MKYLSTSEIAKEWNISERRVRILCSENRIPGALKIGKTFMIPSDAIKPKDKREGAYKLNVDIPLDYFIYEEKMKFDLEEKLSVNSLRIIDLIESNNKSLLTYYIELNSTLEKSDEIEGVRPHKELEKILNFECILSGFLKSINYVKNQDKKWPECCKEIIEKISLKSTVFCTLFKEEFQAKKNEDFSEIIKLFNYENQSPLRPCLEAIIKSFLKAILVIDYTPQNYLGLMIILNTKLAELNYSPLIINKESQIPFIEECQRFKGSKDSVNLLKIIRYQLGESIRAYSCFI